MVTFNLKIAAFNFKIVAFNLKMAIFAKIIKSKY